MKICFATNNQHKIREVTSLLPPDIELLSLKDIGCLEELPETGTTLEENSLQKANYVAQKFHVKNCFADDTGLEVAALDGQPGVFSARYAGLPPNPLNNIDKLLTELSGIKNRSARFRTVITVLIDEKVFVFEGIMNGVIGIKSKGNNGFGYDPIFIPNGYHQTFAEMNSDLKNSISHRGIAVRKLVSFLSAKQQSS